MSRTARLLPAATVGLAMLVTTLGAAPAHASRSVSESYPVPASGKLALTGHGYGHGHGMSQYGAQGAALKGLSYQKILAFYYPGTTLGRATGTIRVLITADNDDDVRVLPAGGLAVRRPGTTASYTVPTDVGATTWRLVASGSGTAVQYAAHGWHVWRTLPGEAEFFRPGPLTLRVAGTTRDYRGALRLSDRDTVNVLGLDDYVKGVVPREMPASWQAAAVRSQAVAARTYAAFDRAAHPTRHYDTCDTSSCQVYGGVGSEDSRSNAAVGYTAGRVLTYGGRPAFTQFGSSSGGWLSAGSQPYLVAKADPYDGYSGNYVHTWTTTLTRSAIQGAYPALGTLKRVLVSRRDGHGDWYGRVEQLRLDGSKSDVTLSGDAFRSRFGLRSSWFRFGSGSTAPAPAAEPTPSTSPVRQPTSPTASSIYKRWRKLGGASSVLGRPTSGEYSVAGGRARRFEHGRIYYKRGVGTRELYGKVFRAYQKRGAATSRLGFPRTRPLRSGKKTYARFEHGLITVRKHGRARVTYS